MSGVLPGVELARRRRLNHHHHQIGPNPSTFRLDFNAYYSYATVGDSSLDQNTLRAKRRLEEKLWNLKPRRGWSKFLYHGNRGTTDEPSPETSRIEPLPGTTHENFQERDLCSARFDGFQSQQSVIDLSCFRGCIHSASALS